MKTSALKSFTGASEVGQKRDQHVLTPPSIVDGLDKLWPGGVDLDPCACDGQLVQAKTRFYETGLDKEWFGNVFVNEPFNELRAWLEKCQLEAVSGVFPPRIVNLCPWRSRRKWFRQAYRSAQGVMLLDPVTFYDSTTLEPWASKSGYETQFPENCCLLYWGPERDRFFEAFAHAGEPL